jgi:hypothetical protein
LQKPIAYFLSSIAEVFGCGTDEDFQGRGPFSRGNGKDLWVRRR